MKKIIALSCFAAVILAGCGKPQQGSSSGTSKATEATTAVQTTEATTTAADTTTEAETTAEATAPQTTTHEANVSAGGRMDMYPAIYQEEIRRVFEQTAKDNDGLANVEYAFRDMDADGIPELILKHGTCEADFEIHIYRYDEDCELRDLGMFGGGHTTFGYDENTGKFVIIWGHMGAASIFYYVWNDGMLKEETTYDFTIDEQHPSYDEVLSEKGIKHIETVSVYQSDYNSGIKSWLYHADGTSEQKEGFYLDYMG